MIEFLLSWEVLGILCVAILFTYFTTPRGVNILTKTKEK